MSAKSASTSPAIRPLLLGLLATALVVAVHLGGGDAKLELQALDFRFAQLSTVRRGHRGF